MHQYKETDGEEDRNTDGKTCVKRYGKCWFKGGRLTGQDQVDE